MAARELDEVVVGQATGLPGSVILCVQMIYIQTIYPGEEQSVTATNEPSIAIRRAGEADGVALERAGGATADPRRPAKY